ncbi:complex I subunit 5 family protein [Fusibacter sp. 3D3]|uniref:complex I subunit 5 family protein n=1 Tax=Fusibacter sp. 3D3 TaxID=1048380 RepID=UPI000853E8B7|nr:complex I subunit 5 family protein [Fusibacter sp. 3D3]GAU79605.1 NADH-ubiquinone oxidoreductase chain M [Fusibacter sp. 3D3]
MNTLVYILILPLLGAFIGYYIGTKNEMKRDLFNIVLTAIELLLVITLFPAINDQAIEYMVPNVMGTGLHLKVDMLRYAMLFISALAWFLTTMYSTQYLIKKKNRNRYYFFFMLTYAMTIGVFMSENIINLFTFFEGMSLTSYALVIHDEDKYSHEAGKSYLAMAIAGGLVMLFGIFLAFDYTGTLDIEEMGKILPNLGDIKYVIALLIMFGFMIKASVFPLHTWLPKAYTAAPTPSSALLSGILLKTGLFGIIIVLVEMMNYDMPIAVLLYCLGLVNIFLGGILAMMQRNIKRIIAYSSMSQTGFMLMGIGLVGILGKEGGLALSATILYMINHAFFKILLFMGTGIIYMILGELSINKISGFGHKKQKLKAFFLIGVLGLCAFPGFNGFVSKTLLHEAILEAYHLTHHHFFKITEYFFIIGGGLTVAYMLKLFVAIFMEKNSDFYGKYNELVHKRALIPMGILAGLIVFIGVFPNAILTPLIRYAEGIGFDAISHVVIYSSESVIYSMMSLLIGVLIYQLFIQRKLYVKNKTGGAYFNPSLGWFSIETDLFEPVLKMLYKVFSFLFTLIDNWLLFTAKILADGIKSISNVDIVTSIDREFKSVPLGASMMLKGLKSKKDALKNIEAKVKINEALELDLVQGQTSKLKELIVKGHSKMTSISNSIFLFGIVVVFCFLFVYVMG